MQAAQEELAKAIESKASVFADLQAKTSALEQANAQLAGVDSRVKSEVESATASLESRLKMANKNNILFKRALATLGRTEAEKNLIEWANAVKVTMDQVCISPIHVGAYPVLLFSADAIQRECDILYLFDRSGQITLRLRFVASCYRFTWPIRMLVYSMIIISKSNEMIIAYLDLTMF